MIDAKTRSVGSNEHTAIRRLHDRLGLGARPGELDRAREAGFDATLAELISDRRALDSARTPEPVLAPVVVPDVGDPGRLAAERAKEADQRRLRLWWLDRMSAAEDALAERLTWYWHDHFATSETKVDYPDLMLTQNRTLRNHGRVSFHTLARAMVADPALIYWLDGQTNRVGAPNENLGRELMELFVLGVGRYSETDVRESARALTGWGIDEDRRISLFQPSQWDPGPETILGRTASFDAGLLVDELVTRPDSARFVVGRLWAALVSPAPPSATTEDSLLHAYGPTTDVAALVAAMARTPEFRASTSALVKPPVLWATGLMRALGVRWADLPDDVADGLVTHLEALGQVPFRPPNVGGWPTGMAWLGPAASIDRLAIANVVTARADLRAAPSSGLAPWAGAVLGIDAWSPRTARALAAVDGPAEVLTVGALCPEYVVSA